MKIKLFLNGKECVGKGAFSLNKIESIKNERIKKWKKLHTKKGRTQANAFLIEGKHLVEEALNASWEIEAILYTEEMDFSFSGETIIVTNAVIKELAMTETPQELLLFVNNTPCQREETQTEFLFC